MDEIVHDGEECACTDDVTIRSCQDVKVENVNFVQCIELSIHVLLAA